MVWASGAGGVVVSEFFDKESIFFGGGRLYISINSYDMKAVTKNKA